LNAEIHIVDDLEDALSIPRKGIPVQLLKTPTVEGLLGIACLDWLIIVATWAGILLLPAWVLPLLILIAASRYHALGVLMHDLAHMRIRQKTLRVRLLEILAGYPLATTVNAMRYHHLRHHRDSGMPTDPYFKDGIERKPLACLLNVLRGVLLVPFWVVRSLYGLLAYYIPSMRNSYARVFLQDISGADLGSSAEVRQCAAEDRWLFLYLLLLGAILPMQPELAIYGYVIPVVIAALLAAHRLLLEHLYEPVSDRRVDSILRTTRDHNLGGPVAFVLAPHNIGYHIAHHLHPQVAWHQLPALRRWYAETYPDSYPLNARPAWHVLAVIAGKAAH